MKRALLFVVLLGVYGVVLEWRLYSGDVTRLDPVAPRAREVEQAIAAKRFSAALPMALELRATYPDEPLVQLWLAEAYRGLDRSREEAAAWERFATIGASPAEACPELAEAWARADATRAIASFKRCVEWDPRNPERLIDLAAAYEREGRIHDGLEVLRQASHLDPGHPFVAQRIDRLLRAGASR